MMKTINNERGAILITILLLMAIVTLIGIIAINTATVDIQISGQTKRSSMAFGGAEAGVDLAIPVIENTLANGALPAMPSGYTIPSGSNLLDEIQSDPTVSPSTFDTDVSISNLNGVAVDIDIDRLYVYVIPGSSLEFASGYEGIGAGAAGGGVGVLYRIDAQGTR